MRTYRLYFVFETGLDWTERPVSFSNDKEKSVGHAEQFAHRYVPLRAIRYVVRAREITWAEVEGIVEGWGRWDARHGEPNRAAAMPLIARQYYLKGYADAGPCEDV